MFTVIPAGIIIVSLACGALAGFQVEFVCQSPLSVASVIVFALESAEMKANKISRIE